MKTLTVTVLMLSMTLGAAAHADGRDRHHEPNRGQHPERAHSQPRAPEHWSREPQHDWQRHDYAARNWNERPYDRREHAPPSRTQDHWARGSGHWDRNVRAYDFHPQHRYYVEHYSRPYAYAPRVWRHGDYLPRAYCAPRYVVDYRAYRLNAPPYGYHYVRVDRDIFLTAVTTGLVVSAVYGIFN
jgi:Ni/Co efflux regulator RcnB